MLDGRVAIQFELITVALAKVQRLDLLVVFQALLAALSPIARLLVATER